MYFEFVVFIPKSTDHKATQVKIYFKQGVEHVISISVMERKDS